MRGFHAIARRMASSSSDISRIVAADAAGIAAAVALLCDGGIAAVPTETVYGLAADAENADAVAKIYAAKGRPAFNPLIVHVADRAMAGRYADFNALAERAASAFWPGPITLVLPLRADAGLASAVTAGLPTVALRVPSHAAMQAVIAGLGRGVAAPSANASGRLSPTEAAHVAASLGDRVPLILDAGPTVAGLESSIVAIAGGAATLLREGAISREAIAAALGVPLGNAVPDAIQAPGMMLAHYAPRLPVRLNAETARAGEWHVGFGEIAGDENLSAGGDVAEAARNLFAALHRAEASGRSAISVAPIPPDGLGAAINDRLHRAAQ